MTHTDFPRRPVTTYGNSVTVYGNWSGAMPPVTRQSRFVDAETGEVFDTFPMLVLGKPKLAEDWLMVMQEALVAVAQDRDLGWEAGRVLMLLLGRVDFENYVRLPQKEIGDLLDMKAPHVSRAVTTLVERNLLLKGPKVSGSWTYRLNSQVAWRGKVKNLRKHRSHTKEPRLRLVAGGKGEAARVEDARQPELLPEVTS